LRTSGYHETIASSSWVTPDPLCGASYKEAAHRPYGLPFSIRHRSALIINGSYSCGAVDFTTSTSKPIVLFHCHCIDCQKQSSSAFGTSAIFPFFKVDDNPSVSSFTRICDSGRKQMCYFCSKCGNRILHAHVVEVGDLEVVAVKGGLLEGLNWSEAKHIYCRSAVVPTPEGVERWEDAPEFGGER
jgi:hypothetical protein